ncbi:unnamed protein product [Chrysoparadoxa australica]
MIKTGGSLTGGLLEYVITNHRWLLCIFFLLPMSVVFELYLYLRNLRAFWAINRKEAKLGEKGSNGKPVLGDRHQRRVQAVQKEVRAWEEDGCPGTMCTARPGWQTMSLREGKYKKTSRNIHLDDFVDILEVNTERKVVRVEPMVTMGQLTGAINPLGWTLPVVPELDDLTIGGLINGVGVETSSHIHGLFQHICESFEMVLADGSAVTCSSTENQELFYHIPWSHGTLGFLVSATIRMVPCQPYVALEYVPFRNKKDAIQLFTEESRKGEPGSSTPPSDFVECLAFGPDEYVVMLGNMVSTQEVKRQKAAGAVVNNIGHYYKPWFFSHVQGFLDQNVRGVEYVPLRHYYHRHTRSLFWEIQDIIPFANNPIFRYLLGWMMPPKPSLLKLTQTETLRQLYERHHVVQDVLVPIKALGDALSQADSLFRVYPLWLCPMRIPVAPDGMGGLIKPLDDGDEMFVDVGIYGNPDPRTRFEAKKSCRMLESYVIDNKGYQMMYADTYLTRAEFRKMFDHKTYDKLRKTLPLTSLGLPEIYDKVCKNNRV